MNFYNTFKGKATNLQDECVPVLALPRKILACPKSTLHLKATEYLDVAEYR